MTQKPLTQLVDEHAIILEKITDKNSDWLKTILTIAVAMLGILITLKSGESANIYQKVSYVVTILSLALGILLCSIALYGQVHTLHLLRKKSVEQIMKSQAGQKIPFLETIPTPKAYLYLERGSLFLFVSALISLIMYALSGEIDAF